jgi:hypothetical protein
MLMRHRGRLAVAVLGTLAFLYAQQFLTVHELQHLFETDSSRCVYTPLTSVGGSAILPVAVVLPAQLATSVDHPQLPSSVSHSSTRAPQARGPPAA